MNTPEAPFLTLRAGSLDLAPPVFVREGASLAEAARAMRRAQATACLVGSAEKALGILTERDVVRAVADGRPGTTTVEAFMSRPVLGIAADELVAEAFLLMIRHSIRRVAVLGASGRVEGLLGERDALAAREGNPAALALELSQAGSPRALAAVQAKLAASTALWLAEGLGATRIGGLAASVRDQIMARAVELALIRCRPPGPMALVALGSEGRREQLLVTDLDNALILGPDADPAAAATFAGIFMDILLEAGLPACPHRVTVDNPDWRGSLRRFGDWIDAMVLRPDSRAVLSLSLMADARCVWGDEGLVRDFAGHLRQAVRDRTMVLRVLAREVARFAPPLGILGRFVLDDGAVDLKHGGIFPLTQGARVLALDLDVAATGTIARLEQAAAAGVLGGDTAQSLCQTFAFLQEVRLAAQLRALDAGKAPGNRVAPNSLSGFDRDRLRQCFRGVASFQSLISSKYALHLLT